MLSLNTGLFGRAVLVSSSLQAGRRLCAHLLKSDSEIQIRSAVIEKVLPSRAFFCRVAAGQIEVKVSADKVRIGIDDRATGRAIGSAIFHYVQSVL